MKPFDLEAALRGEPVQLRSGCKAIILYRVPDVYRYNDGTTILFPLKGIYFTPDGGVSNSDSSWRDDGAYSDDCESERDILGMWEEPTPTVTLTLPKPFKPNDSEPFWFINVRMSGQLKAEYVSSEAVTSFRHLCITQGNCFRTEEDAQAWIDAMRDAVYE